MIQKVFTASTLLQIFEAMIAANQKKNSENVDKYPVSKPKVDLFASAENKNNSPNLKENHGLTKDMMMVI